MTWVIWVLTSNDYRQLPEPLLRRCPPIQLRHLTLAELTGSVRREGMKRSLSEASIEFALEAQASRLDIVCFAEFWAMQEGCSLGGNVFLAPDWPQINPDRDEVDDAPVRGRSRRRRA